MLICIYTFEAFPLKQPIPQAAFVCFSNDKNVDGWIQKDIPLDILSFSRIRQEKIVKILAWKYLSEYDVAIWCKSASELPSADRLLKAIQDSPGEDVWRIGCTTTIDPTGNLNLLSQLEKYSEDPSRSKEFAFTDAIAYSAHSAAFKRFSISWVSETLKESLYDEVSFSHLLSISKGLCVYEAKESLSEGFDCFFKIVVPNYNNGEKLRGCLESILSQSFQDFKIVVVDDCSTDGSLSIAKQFEQSYPDKVFVVESDKRYYSGHARNFGMQYDGFASKYTWFVDGDDKLYSSSVLKLLYEKASATDADMVSFDCIYAKDGASKIHRFAVPDFKDPLSAIEQIGVAPWHRIVKTSKLVPFFENCVRRQDLATVFRQYSNCESIAHLDEICYVYNSCDYATISEPAWSLQQVVLEMKRQSEDASISAPIRDAIKKYLKKYPKVFGKFDGKDLSKQIVVAMASYPPRKDGMLKAMKQLLPQCDYLCLYLNEYKKIPEEIHAELSDEDKKKLVTCTGGKNLKDYGKFFWFGRFPGYYLTVDDDLDYPESYCEALVRELDARKDAVVGMHGNDFTVVDGSFVAKKTCHSFIAKEEVAVPVDCIGTGAACFYPAKMSPSFRDVLLSHLHMDDDLDMSASILVKSEGKMLYRIPSEKDFIGMNGYNFVNPLADIHFAWEKRYIQYDLWLRSSSKRDRCAICCSSAKNVDIAALDELRKKRLEMDKDGVDFFFIPIEERGLQTKNNDSYFVKFELVKKFMLRYSAVSVEPLNEKELRFDFTKEDADEKLGKIWKVKERGLKRISDKILAANLAKIVNRGNVGTSSYAY